jgi:hypothetical protein
MKIRIGIEEAAECIFGFDNWTGVSTHKTFTDDAGQMTNIGKDILRALYLVSKLS